MQSGEGVRCRRNAINKRGRESVGSEEMGEEKSREERRGGGEGAVVGVKGDAGGRIGEMRERDGAAGGLGEVRVCGSRTTVTRSISPKPSK